MGKEEILKIVSKPTDSLGEEFENEGWVDYAHDFKYINESTYKHLLRDYEEVRKMLISIINNPDKWCH